MTSYVTDFPYKTAIKRDLTLYSVIIYAVIHYVQKISSKVTGLIVMALNV